MESGRNCRPGLFIFFYTPLLNSRAAKLAAFFLAARHAWAS
jgi:hypothetical protein